MVWKLLDLVSQRRGVRGTVREERLNAAGDEEPAAKSRASSSPIIKEMETRETV
jgi:hypothetical protein